MSPTTEYPWRTIVRVEVFWKTLAGWCSGAIVDEFHVLTAGHCVYLWSDSPIGWVDSARIVPGADGLVEPYGEAWATYMRTYTGWIVDGDPRHDWALITLDRNVGRWTGWMGRLTAPSWDLLYSDLVNTAGYPGDLGGAYMYRTADYGCAADEFNHYYSLDTAGGQSGSPVWLYDGTDRYILTIHAYGSADGTNCNFGTRLNGDKFDALNAWLTEDAPPVDYADLVTIEVARASFSPIAIAPAVGQLTITHRVANHGTAPSGMFSISYFLSADGLLSPSDFLVGEVQIPSMQPFESTPMTWTGSLPAGIPSESYWVGWIIDSSNSVLELDETNNAVLLNVLLRVDASSPTTRAILSGEAGIEGWHRSFVEVTLEAADVGTGIATTYYRIDGGPWATYAAPVFVNAAGLHVFEYYSEDEVGNAETPNSVQFGIDESPPEVLTILSPGDGTVVATSTVRVSWEGNDALSGIQLYRVESDGAGPQTVGMTSEYTFRGVSDGPHVILVTIVDRAGNERTVSISIRVDTNPLSLTGPFGPMLLLGSTAVVVLIGVSIALIIRHKRRRAATESRERRPPA